MNILGSDSASKYLYNAAQVDANEEISFNSLYQPVRATFQKLSNWISRTGSSRDVKRYSTARRMPHSSMPPIAPVQWFDLWQVQSGNTP